MLGDKSIRTNTNALLYKSSLFVVSLLLAKSQIDKVFRCNRKLLSLIPLSPAAYCYSYTSRWVNLSKQPKTTNAIVSKKMYTFKCKNIAWLFSYFPLPSFSFTRPSLPFWNFSHYSRICLRTKTSLNRVYFFHQ